VKVIRVVDHRRTNYNGEAGKEVQGKNQHSPVRSVNRCFWRFVRWQGEQESAGTGGDPSKRLISRGRVRKKTEKKEENEGGFLARTVTARRGKGAPPLERTKERGMGEPFESDKASQRQGKSRAPASEGITKKERPFGQWIFMVDAGAGKREHVIPGIIKKKRRLFSAGLARDPRHHTRGETMKGEEGKQPVRLARTSTRHATVTHQDQKTTDDSKEREGEEKGGGTFGIPSSSSPASWKSESRRAERKGQRTKERR